MCLNRSRVPYDMAVWEVNDPDITLSHKRTWNEGEVTPAAARFRSAITLTSQSTTLGNVSSV